MKKKQLLLKEEFGFIFSCFTTQCAIETRTFVVLHYYISIFVVTVDFFCSSTNQHGHCVGGP